LYTFVRQKVYWRKGEASGGGETSDLATKMDTFGVQFQDPVIHKIPVKDSRKRFPFFILSQNRDNYGFYFCSFLRRPARPLEI